MPEERDIVDLLFKQAEIQTKLSNSLVQLTQTTEDMNDTLKGINAAFSNGFRREIKDHITTEIRSPAFFVKLFASVMLAVGSIAAVVVALT